MASLGASSRKDIVTYEIPAQQGIEAHTGAFVVVQDGAGVTRHYGWYEAACSRVMRQDALQSDHLRKTGAITQAVQEKLLRYLGTTCGTPDPLAFRNKLQVGASILAGYSKLAPEEQVIWLAQDSKLREACLPNLNIFLESSQYFARSTTLQTAQERQPYLDDVDALELLISIFRQQTTYVREVQIRLLRSLPQDKAIDLAERCNLPAPVMAAPPAPVKQTMPTSGVSARAPLAPIPPNVQVPPAAPGNLKRKRVEPASRTVTEVIDLCGDEDEEEAELQGKADALQARIDAIRARTAHEDQLMPSKKARSQAKTSQPVRTVQPPVSQIPQPNQEKKPDLKDMTLSQALAQPAPVPKTTTSGGAPPVPAAAAASSRLRINVQMQGRDTLKLSISPENHFNKLIRTAKKAWSIPDDQEVYLKLDGRKIDPQQRVRRTTLRDLGYLDLHVIPAAVAPQPLLKQVSIKPPAPEPPRPIHGRVTGFAPAQPKSITRPPVMDLTSSSPPRQEAPPPPPPPAAPANNGPELCREQQDVVDLIMAGKNVFYTGSAGCGKSTVLKSFVPKLRECGLIVRIIAPTGKAALDINGSTTWTFAGWTPLHMKRPLKELLKAAHGRFVNKRLKETDVLVIDEVSMVENHLFQRLDALMREARGDQRAFGGVQLIVTGDFCQLPPVKPFQFCMTCGREQPQRMTDDGKTVYRCPQHGDCRDEDKWAFRSAAWEACEFHHVNLSTIHRQSDEVFIKILQKLRTGTGLTDSDRRLLLDHPNDVNNAVKLFPTRDQVKRINQTEFDQLPSTKHSYTCLDNFKWNKELHPHLESKGRRSPFDDSLDALREHRLDNFVELKKDMLVVLLVNLEISSGLVNGSQGRIVDFEPYDPAKLPKARREVNDSGSRSGFLKSSQSRNRSARGGSMEPDGGGMFQGELRGEHAALREGLIRWFINHPRNKSKLWPVVEFDNGIKRTIYADCQINELGDEAPYTLLARTQIPLVAAWAMTIHKSQGMTLNRVIVDLGKSFEEGQEYVALSRARSLDGLQVISLGEGVGKGGNAQVKEFLWEKFRIR